MAHPQRCPRLRLRLRRSLHTQPLRPGGADERNSATVVLIIELAVDGAVRGVEIEKSSGYPKLDAAAAEGATRWLFNPLQVDGQPAAGKVRVPVQFPLD